MFTGIIEEVGRMAQIIPGHRSCQLKVECHTVLVGTRIGDSIAVNGICFTVTNMGKDWFSADATPETMRRTALYTARPGASVNLERPLALGMRFGGHIVSGHVDGTGRIVSVVADENAVNVTISLERDKMKYILEKGSIAVDGISLTVTRIGKTEFSVSLIPHTGKNTALLVKHVGDLVNIECDCIGKYVERLMNEKPSGDITMDTLRECGFTGGQHGSF